MARGSPAAVFMAPGIEHEEDEDKNSEDNEDQDDWLSVPKLLNASGNLVEIHQCNLHQ
jgi:hypothetical protein